MLLHHPRKFMLDHLVFVIVFIFFINKALGKNKWIKSSPLLISIGL